MGSLNGWERGRVEAIANSLKDRTGALMRVLREIRDELGYIPPDSVPIIAQILNLSRAEVHGVISFYHDFRTSPAGRYTIQLCRAESCQAKGAVALAEHVKRRLGVDLGMTTPDNTFTLEPVYCLGNCACSPAMMINGTPYGRVSAARFDAIVAQLTARDSGERVIH